VRRRVHTSPLDRRLSVRHRLQLGRPTRRARIRRLTRRVDSNADARGTTERDRRLCIRSMRPSTRFGARRRRRRLPLGIQRPRSAHRLERTRKWRRRHRRYPTSPVHESRASCRPTRRPSRMWPSALFNFHRRSRFMILHNTGDLVDNLSISFHSQFVLSEYRASLPSRSLSRSRAHNG